MVANTVRVFLFAFVIALYGCQATEVTNDTVLPPGECFTDADCAVAGCSGQLCAPKEEASDIITTCEYKDEYACLKMTNCGCVNNKCAWAQTQGYSECLESLQAK